MTKLVSTLYKLTLNVYYIKVQYVIINREKYIKAMQLIIFYTL